MRVRAPEGSRAKIAVVLTCHSERATVLSMLGRPRPLGGLSCSRTAAAKCARGHKAHRGSSWRAAHNRCKDRKVKALTFCLSTTENGTVFRGLCSALQPPTPCPVLKNHPARGHAFDALPHHELMVAIHPHTHSAEHAPAPKPHCLQSASRKRNQPSSTPRASRCPTPRCGWYEGAPPQGTRAAAAACPSFAKDDFQQQLAPATRCKPPLAHGANKVQRAVHAKIIPM